jgi:hypothetical protein
MTESLSFQLVATPYTSRGATPRRLVAAAQRMRHDPGLQRDLPEVIEEFSDEQSAKASVMGSQLKGRPRFAVFEIARRSAMGEQLPVPDSDYFSKRSIRPIGCISLNYTLQYDLGAAPGIARAGMKPEELGPNVCYWADRDSMQGKYTAVSVARLAIALGREHSLNGGEPWIILSSHKDGPSREYKQAGMLQHGEYTGGWFPSAGVGDQQYALFVANSESPSLRVEQRGAAYVASSREWNFIHHKEGVGVKA